MFKKSTTKQSKAILALSIALIALIAFTSAITFAYFTSSATKDSGELTFGTLTVGIGEFAATADETPVVPGCTLTLSGDVTNTANIDSYVRFKITATVTGSKDTNNTLQTAINNGLVVAGVGTDDGIAFFDGKDGYFYAKATKNVTKVMDLKRVTVKIDEKTVGNDYQGAKVKFAIVVEAIQASHTTLNGVDITADNAANLAKEAAWKTIKTDGILNQ